MSELVDLDALVPESVNIKFGGTTVEVKPPKTADLLRLGTLGGKLGDVTSLSEAELESIIDQLTAQIHKLIPELVGKELNTIQLLKLVQIFADMALPSDAKELEKLGIKPTGGKANDPKDQ